MSERNPTTHFLPDVKFFEALFLPSPDDLPSDGTPSSGRVSPSGFPRGSSIVVTGKPGVGKAYFTLALVRELMRKHNKSILCYIRIGSQSIEIYKHFSL